VAVRARGIFSILLFVIVLCMATLLRSIDEPLDGSHLVARQDSEKGDKELRSPNRSNVRTEKTTRAVTVGVELWRRLCSM
jgi:hypothetical protein